MTNQNKCPDDWPDDFDLVEKKSTNKSHPCTMEMYRLIGIRDVV